MSTPKAIGPYSLTVSAGDLTFCSGQVGLDPTTGELVKGGLVAQVRQGLENLSACLGAKGLSLSDVVKTTVFLVSMDDFAEMNVIYAEFFTDPHPARSTVAVAALPKGAFFEIDAIATM